VKTSRRGHTGNREVKPVEQEEQHRDAGQEAGTAAIKWGAIVIIVLAILWFLARYVIPLLPGA